MKRRYRVSRFLGAAGLPFMVMLLLVSGLASAQVDLAQMGTDIGTGFKTWITLGIQIISVLMFLAVGYGVVAKFLSAIGGRTGWGEVMMPILVGAVVLIACAYFFNQATTLVEAISAA